MKRTLAFLFFASLSTVHAREIVADFASVINQAPKSAKSTFGNPDSSNTRPSGVKSATWAKGDWSWHVNVVKDKVIQACVASIPEGVTYKDIADLVAAFGFTPEKGWTIGQPQKFTPFVDSIFLTHKEKGVFLLRATKAEEPGKWSVLNFFAPGYDKAPQ